MKEFNYKINGAPYRVIINSSDSSVVELEVNGTPFRVELEKKESKPLSKIKKQAITTPTPQTASTPLRPDRKRLPEKYSYSRRFRVLFSISSAR